MREEIIYVRLWFSVPIFTARSILIFVNSVRFRVSLSEGRCRVIIWGFIHSYFIIIFYLNLATELLKTDLHQFLVMYKTCKKWQENWSNWKKYCHFKISLLFLSKSNDNFRYRFDNSNMRVLSKKSTIYFSNRKVTFQIDWISSQNENFLVDFRNCQIESKTCQLFFSVHIFKKLRNKSLTLPPRALRIIWMTPNVFFDCSS